MTESLAVLVGVHALFIGLVTFGNLINRYVGSV